MTTLHIASMNCRGLSGTPKRRDVLNYLKAIQGRRNLLLAVGARFASALDA